MATLFCAAGYPLVTDDVLPVAVSDRGDVSCVPGGILLRVRPKAEAVIDHLAADVPRGLTADGRHGVSPRLTGAARLQLRAAVIPLPDREHTRCESRLLAPIEAMMTLTRFQRIEGWKSDHELRGQFAMISRVVGSVPVLAVRVPWAPRSAPTSSQRCLTSSVPPRSGAREPGSPGTGRSAGNLGRRPSPRTTTSRRLAVSPGGSGTPTSASSSANDRSVPRTC